MASSSSSSLSAKQQQDTTTAAAADDGERLSSLVKQYLLYEKIPQHRQFVERLKHDNDTQQLERLIGKRLTFGTAGIRGSMGPGFGQMNDLVIIQTSQGLASYLLELDAKVAKEQGVIIGNDARHNSARFARLAALAFLHKGIPVYFCDHIVPTPLIAFGVPSFGCCAGIVVTASHNPKNDNGYKVYGSNGAQILAPHDRRIQEHILMDENQKPWPRAWQHELLLLPPQCSSKNGQPPTTTTTPATVSPLPEDWEQLLFRIHGDLSKNYFAYIETLVGDRRPLNESSNISITYTTMHGVGHTFLARALDIAGFKRVFPVEAQKMPDPDFPTVRFPNPEEAGALDLAFSTAKHTNSNLILANDPDADRCAAALYDPETDYRRVLTGDEIGALLGWWLWHCYMAAGGANGGVRDAPTPTDSQAAYSDANDTLPTPQQQRQLSDEQVGSKTASDCFMISTAVSSKFLRSMAREEGFQFVETLTGFKYMGNLAEELIKRRNKKVLFAYEEAIGYMVDSSILDKDGISAALQLAQCAAHVQLTYGRTLEQQLDWLYTVYGYHFSLNSYYACSDPKIVGQIFKELQSAYPSDFGEKFKVKRVRDLNTGYDSGTADGKPTLPCSSSSFMVTFFVDDDITFTIRTSGTEPKIKYYSEIVAKLPPLDLSSGVLESNNFNDATQRAAKETARERLHRLVEAAVERCLKPQRYHLQPAA